MQPDDSDFDTIRELEARLLRPQVRRSPEELSRLLADDFVEFGSSGSVFDKQSIIQALQQGPGARYALQDLQVKLLGPGVALATYVVTRSTAQERTAARSLRSSIWVCREGGWQIVVHQGTLADDQDV